MQKGNNRDMWFVGRAKIPAVIFILLCAVYLGYQIKNIKLDFGFHTFFEASKDLPKLMEYKERYGEDINLVIIIVEADDIFTERVLESITRLTNFLEMREEIEEVTSLTKVDVIRSKEDEISVEPFIERIPSSVQELKHLRREAISNRVLKRYLISDDGKTTAVIGQIYGYLRRQNKLLDDIDRFMERERKLLGGQVSFYLGGVNVIQREYERVATSDIIVNGLMIILVMGFCLLLQYGRIAGVVLPLFCAVVTTAIVTGLMSVTDQPINMVTQLVPVLMIILGIADGIYILSRHFEESRVLPSVQSARITITHMALACFFTSFTTAVGFGSLYAAQMNLIEKFGIYCGAGVMISYVNVILINSVVLPHLNPHGRKRMLSPGVDITGRVLKWAVFVIFNHRRKVVLVSVVIVICSVALTTRIQMQHKLLSELYEDNPVVKANSKFESELFGILSYGIEFKGPPNSMVEPEVLSKIDRIVKLVKMDSGVRKTSSLPEILKEFNMHWMGEGEKYYKLPASKRLAVQYLEFLDPEMKRKIVNEDYSRSRIMIMAKNLPSSWWYNMMERVEPYLKRMFPPEGKIKYDFNGSSHLAAKTLHHLMKDLLSTMILSVVTITILMCLLFRSVRLGLVSMIANVVPIIMTFGFMAAAGIALRPATAIIFAISLGIAVNDTIHLFARYREERIKNLTPVEAIETAIMSAGRPIVYTSVLLVAGYIVLLRCSFVAEVHFSILLTVTLVSALWADLLLTPIVLLAVEKNSSTVRLEKVGGRA